MRVVRRDLLKGSLGLMTAAVLARPALAAGMAPIGRRRPVLSWRRHYNADHRPPVAPWPVRRGGSGIVGRWYYLTFTLSGLRDAPSRAGRGKLSLLT